MQDHLSPSVACGASCLDDIEHRVQRWALRELMTALPEAEALHSELAFGVFQLRGLIEGAVGALVRAGLADRDGVRVRLARAAPVRPVLAVAGTIVAERPSVAQRDNTCRRDVMSQVPIATRRNSPRMSSYGPRRASRMTSHSAMRS